MPPIVLDSRAAGLQGARAALRPPPRRPASALGALACATLMALAATAAAAVVVLGGWEPARGEAAPPAEVRAALAG